jgi:hypothetical protein
MTIPINEAEIRTSRNRRNAKPPAGHTKRTMTECHNR